MDFDSVMDARLEGFQAEGNHPASSSKAIAGPSHRGDISKSGVALLPRRIFDLFLFVRPMRRTRYLDTKQLPPDAL
jgi:hypothetical protein